MTTWHVPQGYRFAGIHCGLRSDPERRDLALMVSDRPATVAGVFTRNRVRAAPVRVSRERVPANDGRGVVVCSGNANACTGQRGLEDARRMTVIAAEAIGCRPEQMLVCSTGIIGQYLPMSCLESGIRAAAGQLETGVPAFEHAARAILTTDTRIKLATQTIQVGDSEVRIAGLAKGASMMGPNMATMLAFVFTDAAVSAPFLTTLARRSVDQSFHAISVEGHTSTNDTVLFFANGTGPHLEGDALARLEAATTQVTIDLARAIAGDAEGATHLITIEVEGLRDDAEARRVAKAIADSALVKTAIFGADPNWGRIVSAAGYAGVEFEEEQLTFWLGDMLLYRSGTPQPFDAAAASAYLKNNREIHLRLRFTLGSGRCTFWTCDLTYEYVRLNAEYTT